MKFTFAAKGFLKNNYILILICLLGLNLRLLGINFGLPNYYFQPDERRLVEPAIHMVVNFAYTKDFSKLDPNMYIYPHGGVNIYFLSFYIVFYVLKVIDKIFGLYPPLFNNLHNPDFFLIARAVVAVFGALLSLVGYKIARNLKFNKKYSLLYSVLLAVNFGLVVDSHFATANTISIFFAFLSTLLCVLAINNGNKINKFLILVYLSSFLVGIASSIRNLMIIYFVQVLIVLFIIYKKSFLNLVKHIIISGLFVILGAFIFSPYIFINHTSFIEDGILGIENVEKGGQLGRTATNYIYPFFNNNKVDFDQKIPNSLFGNAGELTFILSIFFIFYKIIKKRSSTDLIFLSVLVLQILFINRYPSQMVRWYINLIPILLIYFVYFIKEISYKKWLVIILVCFVFGLQFFRSFEYGYSKTLNDTREIADRWIKSSALFENAERTYKTFWGPHISAKEVIEIEYNYYEYLHLLHERSAPNASWYFCNKYVKNDYVIVSSYVTNVYKLKESKKRYPEFSKSWNNFYDYVFANFKIVKVFKGDRLFSNPGPTITILKVQCNED